MSGDNSNSIINLDHSSNKQNEQTSNFSFNNNTKLIENNLAACSVTDSAYDSLVCSPFSPIIISNSNKPTPSDYQDAFPNTHSSISPFLEATENDEVFKISFEQIYTESKPSISLRNSIFRPISSDRDTDLDSNVRHLFHNADQSNIPLRQIQHRSSSKSHRSISTQTKFSIGSMGCYRPNSAPLQEGIEEELSEIETSAIESSSYQITRNSTCHCIRSPMPDLIQPTFQRDNQLLVSRLSLIADQIDQDMSPLTTPIQRNRRSRRFSTPSMSEISPGGSFFDLLVSIYHVFDNRAPRQRSATYSYNETEEEESSQNH